MPRLSNQVPKYRKHRASGQAVVTIGGRDLYLGPHGSSASRVEYDRLIAEWLASGRPTAPQMVELTIAEVMLQYWKFAKSYYRKDGRPTNELSALRVALKPVKTLYGATAAGDFGPLALKTVRKQMIEAGFARSTINNSVGRIKRMFRWAASEELVPASVPVGLDTVAGLRKGKSSARETDPVSAVKDSIVEQTLPFLPHTVADMVRLQRLTGMRPSEVTQIRPGDLDRSGGVWLYRPASHKTEHRGRSRTVLLGPKSQAILQPYLKREAAQYCFQPCESELGRRRKRHSLRKTPLSCGNKPSRSQTGRRKRVAGTRYHTTSYGRAISRACSKAGVDRWSPNQLRHAAATEVRRRFGLEAAQVILGHAGADVTEIYAARDIAKGIEVAKLIG